MIIAPDATELLLLGPFDRNVPNSERIVLRPQMRLQLGYYGVGVGVHVPGTKAAVPISDVIYWFGEVEVGPPDWVFLYTTPGENNVTTVGPASERAFVFFWSRLRTMFANSSLVPMLFRVGAVSVGEPPTPAFQQGLLKGPTRPSG
jgi:hypothetical protein